ncbi:MAG: DNA methyltransferase [Promethearchaeota archaeon]
MNINESIADKFFGEYKVVFFNIRDKLIEQGITKKKAHEFTLQFLNRIMFIYFISEKKWLNNNAEFISYFWGRYLSAKKKGEAIQDSFYDKWLKTLFFKAFNNKNTEIMHDNYFPKDLKDIFSNFPYLNDELFKENDLDNLNIKIGDSIFETLFDRDSGLFERYKFILKEDFSFKKECIENKEVGFKKGDKFKKEEKSAIDPSMLSYVYECLSRGVGDSYNRKSLGIFYTQKVEVNFMCRRVLVEYLSKNLEDIPKFKIYRLVFNENPNNLIENHGCNGYFLRKENWIRLKNVLDNLSLVDPACGSGAFLVGMLKILEKIYRIIYKNINNDCKVIKTSDLKKSIVSRSLYGVDILPLAVQTTKFRLWLNIIGDMNDRFSG